MNPRSTLIIAAMLVALFVNAQLSTKTVSRIDSLFVEWQSPNHPGGSVAIMQNGKMVYSKAFGLASLEYSIPNTPGTQFNIGSVSKQLTAMGIVLLHLQGKLSVDDEIQKYLIELPDFGEKITIRHMLHHTSGLRSLHALFAMAGWRGDDYRTNEDLYRIMKNQKELNFKPGSEYLYCNTGFMFMADIIEQVTGEKFPVWMKKNVFVPLGMNETYVEDNYARIVPNNATSYYGSSQNGFERATEYWGYVGSGNVHTTTDDLLKWSSNFYTPQSGWEKAFETMLTLDPFNDGKQNNYAFGISVGEFNGTRRVGHGGAVGGFRAELTILPEKKLSIVVLTNFSSANPGGKVNEIMNMLVSKPTPGASKTKKSKSKPAKVSVNELKKYEGSYWNDKEGYVRKLSVINDTLWYVRTPTNQSALLPLGGNKFNLQGTPSDVVLVLDSNGAKSIQFFVGGTEDSHLTGYAPVDETPDLLKTYVGKYYSPEIETTYRIYFKDGKLMMNQVRVGDVEMKLLKYDAFDASWPLGTVIFVRDASGKPSGFKATNGRVRNMWFKKVD